MAHQRMVRNLADAMKVRATERFEIFEGVNARVGVGCNPDPRHSRDHPTPVSKPRSANPSRWTSPSESRRPPTRGPDRVTKPEPTLVGERLVPEIVDDTLQPAAA